MSVRAGAVIHPFFLVPSTLPVREDINMNGWMNKLINKILTIKCAEFIMYLDFCYILKLQLFHKARTT